MDYIGIFKELIGSLGKDADMYISGNKEDYLYKRQHTEETGDTDCNYNNRRRLLTALVYNVRDIPEPDREKFVRELFETEIVSRENESFHGIGDNLEMLTYLMHPYRTKEDEKLFERAKNANFDCFCGYEYDNPDAYSYYGKSIDEFSLERCIYTAGDLGFRDYTCRLVDIFKAQKLDTEDYRSLKSFAEYTGRKEDLELAIKGRFETAKKECDDIFDIMCAYNDYIEMLAEDGEYEKAFELYMECRPYFAEYERPCMETGVKLMLLSSAHAAEIWKIIKPIIRKEAKRDGIAPIICDDVIKCAEMIGESKIAESVKKSYDRIMAEIRKIHEED